MAAPISEHNKEPIIGYRDACLLHQVCGTVRLIRAFFVLRHTALLLAKDFDTANRKDIEGVLAQLQGRQLSAASIATYKAIIRRFYGWLCCPDEFPRIRQQPPLVGWMTVHLRKADERRLPRNDLLTDSDVAQLLTVCNNARDKAFVSMLWETGCRIAELATCSSSTSPTMSTGTSSMCTARPAAEHP
jgi:site-specific recombinase XerD